VTHSQPSRRLTRRQSAACPNGTDHPDHLTPARLIRRYIAWRDAHLDDAKLRHVVRRAKAAKVA
jgi:hypothetical protein